MRKKRTKKDLEFSKLKRNLLQFISKVRIKKGKAFKFGVSPLVGSEKIVVDMIKKATENKLAGKGFKNDLKNVRRYIKNSLILSGLKVVGKTEKGLVKVRKTTFNYGKRYRAGKYFHNRGHDPSLTKMQVNYVEYMMTKDGPISDYHAKILAQIGNSPEATQRLAEYFGWSGGKEFDLNLLEYGLNEFKIPTENEIKKMAKNDNKLKQFLKRKKK